MHVVYKGSIVEMSILKGKGFGTTKARGHDIAAPRTKQGLGAFCRVPITNGNTSFRCVWDD